MTRTLISVVLPVFNEYENIGPCLRGLARALDGHEHEILVCYDFDEDTTLRGIAEMQDAPASMRLVKNTLGRGAPNAIRAGFQAARGDVVVTTMADLSDPPEVIVKMAEKIRAGADVVAGSRYVSGGSQEGGPLLKRFLSECAGRSLAWIAGVGTQDATSNFRGYSKRFLDRVTVESRAGFEIALELTVKAHLSGGRVDEVPSTWVDRTAGTSRFKLWKWLPNYLRWYLRATVAPLVVWGVWAVMCALGVLNTRGSGENRAIELMFVAFEAAFAALAILLVRRARRRTALADVVLPVAWLLPVWLSKFRAHEVLVGFVAAGSWSAVHALAAGGWRRRNECGAWVARWVSAHVTEANVGLVLVWLLLWLSRFTVPGPTSGPDLDASWMQALGAALARGMQFGTEIVFTYGPLGYFGPSPYEPDLYWTKILWWEGLLRLALCGAFVLASRRIHGPLEKAAYLLVILLIDPGQDAFYFASAAVVTSLLITEKPPRTAILAFAFACLAAIALVKFTFFLLVVAGVGLVAVSWGWRAGWVAFVRVVALFVAVLCAVWALCGQNPLHLPRYVQTSLWIAGAYNEAMSVPGPPLEVELACWIFGLAAVASLAHLLRRPWRMDRALNVVLFAACLAMSFKAGFVRHMQNSSVFFAAAAVACFLLPSAPSAGLVDRSLSLLASGTRIAAVAFCVYGYGTALGHDRYRFVRLTGDWGALVQRNLQELQDLPGLRRTRNGERIALRAQHDLPRVRERVGDATIDHFFCSQAILLLNDLNWRPRPVFQSYVTFAPELLELNARFMESDRAPEFLLFRNEGSDFRVPASDDGLAVEVLLRNYQPVLSENGWLLLEQRPVGERAPPASRRMLMERTIGFDEWVDLTSIENPCVLLALDIEYTLLGRMKRVLTKIPVLQMEAAISTGEQAIFRVLPAMMHSGVIVTPFMNTDDRWIRWFAGVPDARMERFRLLIPPSAVNLLEPRVAMRVMAADELVPPPSAGSKARLLFSMFDRNPTKVTSIFPAGRAQSDGREVLMVHAPSELVFDVPAGARRAQASFGLIAEAWMSGGTDGVRFDVVTRGVNGRERVLFQRMLDPVRIESDRGLQSVDVELPAATPKQLILRTDPGPSGSLATDWAFWTGLEFD